MALYLLHFSEPLAGGQHPQHYLGWTDRPVAERLADHLVGRNRPAKIVQAAVAAGRTVTISRVWPDGTRSDEARLKRRKRGFRRHCPLCTPTVGR